MILAVTLDAGDTMLYCDPTPAEIFARALSRYGRTVEAAEVAPVFREAWATLQQRTLPGRDRYSSVDGDERQWWGAFLEEVLGRLQLPAPAEPLLDDLFEAFGRPGIWHLCPDTREALNDLRQRGLKLAVISNWDSRLPGILDALDLTGFFDHITVSSLVGAEKPAPEIFAGTLTALGVEPAVALHVGDSPREDYHGARGAGLQAGLIDRRGQFSGTDYRCFGSLADIGPWVETYRDGAGSDGAS